MGSWIGWVVASYLAVGVGSARWLANQLEVEPWRSRMEHLFDAGDIEGSLLTPTLLKRTMVAGMVVFGPPLWPVLWWNGRHDDERPR